MVGSTADIGGSGIWIRVAFDADDDGGGVIVSAAEVGEVNEQPGRIGRGEVADDLADFGVVDMIGNAIGTEHVDIAGFDGEGAFDIDLDEGVRSEAAGDDISGVKEFDIFGGSASESDHFPLEAVVEGELLDESAAEAVESAVADVSGDGTCGGEAEGGAGGAHAFEFAVFAGAIVDGFVGGEDSVVDGIFDRAGGVFGEGIRECIDADAAGEIADGMATNAVSDDEEVSDAGPFGVVVADADGEGVLIDGAAHTHVSARGILHNGGSCHGGYSGCDCLRSRVARWSLPEGRCGGRFGEPGCRVSGKPDRDWW